jgi:hypothetical protein
MASNHWWPTAATPDHIQGFCQLMVDKGYRGIVASPTRNEKLQVEHSPDAFTQMEKELSKYVASCTDHESPVNPFHINSCMFKPAQGKLPPLFTDVDLEMTYNRHHGFNAVWLRIAQLANSPDRNNTTVELSTRVSNNQFIPTAIQAASLQVPDASRMKLSDLFDEEKVEQHIEALRDVLARKGYKALFAGRVNDVPLRSALREPFLNARAHQTSNVKPFKLITQLSAPDLEQRKNAPVIEGQFMTTYSPVTGFRIREFSVWSSAEGSRRIERRVNQNDDIPSKADALIMSHRRKHAIKR